MAVTLVLLDYLVETIGAASSPISIRIAWQLGRLGVILFFVHTTYVLMMSMQRRGLTGPTLVKDFYVRRGFRIYPLALAAVATVILFGIPRTPWSGLHPELTPVTVLSNVLLVQDLTGAPALLGPMWNLPGSAHVPGASVPVFNRSGKAVMEHGCSPLDLRGDRGCRG